MTRKLSTYFLIAGAVCAAAAADMPSIESANATIAASIQSEAPGPVAREMQITSLDETFPSAESALAAASSSQAAMRFEH